MYIQQILEAKLKGIQSDWGVGDARNKRWNNKFWLWALNKGARGRPTAS